MNRRDINNYLILAVLLLLYFRPAHCNGGDEIDFGDKTDLLVLYTLGLGFAELLDEKDEMFSADLPKIFKDLGFVSAVGAKEGICFFSKISDPKKPDCRRLVIKRRNGASGGFVRYYRFGDTTGKILLDLQVKGSRQKDYEEFLRFCSQNSDPVAIFKKGKELQIFK